MPGVAERLDEKKASGRCKHPGTPSASGCPNWNKGHHQSWRKNECLGGRVLPKKVQTGSRRGSGIAGDSNDISSRGKKE